MKTKKEMSDPKSREYWFDNPLHEGEDNFGENYYGNIIFREVINKLQDVPDGYIVVMGANRGVCLDVLSAHFGEDRVIGYDLHNPANHPKIIEMDVMNLDDSHNIPIAFVHNDIGSYPTLPVEKHFTQLWAAKNVVEGGYFLGRNNFNVAGYKNEDILESLGFKNYQFEDLRHFFDLSALKDTEIEGHILSRRG